MKNKLFYLLILFIFFSCQNNKEKYRYLDIEEAIDVGYPYGSIVYKSKDRHVFDNVILLGNVVSFHENNVSIFASQKINKTYLKPWIEYELNQYKYRENQKIYLSGYQVPDSLMKEYITLGYPYDTNVINEMIGLPFFQRLLRDSVNYWIILKKNDSVIGPLDSIEFIKMSLMYQN